MKSLITRLFIVVAGVCLLFPAGRAMAASATPDPLKVKEKDLQEIVDTLKQIKTLGDPGSGLDMAKKQLAKQEKRTTRTKEETEAKADLEKASTAVDAAKDALTAGDKVKMQELVDHAEAQVKMAIEAKERKN